MGKQWQGDENLRRNMMKCGKNSIKTIANWWNSGDRGKDDDKDKEDVLQEEVEVEEKPGVEGEAKQEDVRLKEEEEEEEVKGEPMRLALRTLGVSWNRPLSTGTVAKIGQTNHF